MKNRIAICGNSLALRVPQPFAEEVALEEGSEVELSLVDGSLVLAPFSGSEWTLGRLVAGITPKNIHAETGLEPADHARSLDWRDAQAAEMHRAADQ